MGKESTTRHWGHWVFLCIITLLTVSVYYNTLHGELQFDDRSLLFSIPPNPAHQSPYAFKEINLWHAFKSGARPVTTFTYSLNYFIWGGDVFSYHLANLFIHLLNSVLVYALVCITIKDNAQRIAFLTALLFSIHPIQTQSVSYIYQRTESLSAMFYLVSLLSFITASRYNGLKKILFMMLFVLGFILALGSKETAITLPAIAFLYGIYFFERKGLWKNLLVPGSLIIAGGFIAATRGLAPDKYSSAGYNLPDFNAWEYLLTQFSAVAAYLRLLIFPVGQSIDHLYPISRSFWEAGTVTGFALLAIIFFMALFLRKKWRAGSFFIIWFFITISPTSSILPIRDVFVEHRLYLPSLGVFFVFASGVAWVYRLNDKKKEIVAFLSVIIAALLWTATYHRNNLWDSRLAMWQDAARKYPGKPRAHYWLGFAYSGHGLLEKALEHYLTALRLDPYDTEVHTRLAELYVKKGRFDKAIEHYEFLLKAEPGNQGLRHLTGTAYANLNKFDAAIFHYQAALRSKPDYHEAHNGLGLVYEKLKRYDESVYEIQAALRIKPDTPLYHYNLGNVYYRLKQFDQAVKHYKNTIQLNPNDPDVYHNLGYVYYKQGKLTDSIMEFQTALRLSPDNTDVRYYLGIAYLKKGLKEMARAEFETTIRLKPDHILSHKALELSSKRGLSKNAWKELEQDNE